MASHYVFRLHISRLTSVWPTITRQWIFIQDSNKTRCSETSFSSMRTHLSRTTIALLFHPAYVFFHCFVLSFCFYLFIILLIDFCFVIYCFSYFVPPCVHILTKYNGWNSRLLSLPKCKQMYVKQFIACKK